MTETKKVRRKVNKMTIVESDLTSPSIKLKPGMKVEVQKVKLIGENGIKPKPIAARLCGGSGTCLALIELD